MRNNDILMIVCRTIFIIMGLVVMWHIFAPKDWHVLTENGRKLWAMAGLGLYIVILIERHRRGDG